MSVLRVETSATANAHKPPTVRGASIPRLTVLVPNLTCSWSSMAEVSTEKRATLTTIRIPGIMTITESTMPLYIAADRLVGASITPVHVDMLMGASIMAPPHNEDIWQPLSFPRSYWICQQHVLELPGPGGRLPPGRPWAMERWHRRRIGRSTSTCQWPRKASQRSDCRTRPSWPKGTGERSWRGSMLEMGGRFNRSGWPRPRWSCSTRIETALCWDSGLPGSARPPFRFYLLDSGGNYILRFHTVSSFKMLIARESALTGSQPSSGSQERRIRMQMDQMRQERCVLLQSRSPSQ